MRRGRSRWAGSLLALALLLGLLPGTVWAAGTQGRTITVLMTIYDQGVPAQDKSQTPMLLREIQVTDRNGDGRYSLDEALAAAHAEYAPNGASDYDVASNGLVSKLWGRETESVGLCRNDQWTKAANEEILEQGDRVTAFTYKDSDHWSDRYSYFTEDHLTVCVEQEFELTLLYAGSSVLPQATAPIGVFEENGEYSVPETLLGEKPLPDLLPDYRVETVATGLDGKVKMSFAEPGDYLLTAQYDLDTYTVNSKRYYLVPPLCTVTVLSAVDYVVYEQTQKYLDQAADQLTWDTILGEENEYSYAVTSNLTLPTQLTVEEELVAVTWSCDDNTGALGSGGYVVRPAAQDVSCTLTAELSYEDATATKEFPITVKAEGVSEDKVPVNSYSSMLTNIASRYADSTDPWVVLEMAAYDGTKLTGFNSTSIAGVLAAVATQNEVDLSTLSNHDYISEPWNIPYVLLAYDAAGADTAGFTNTREELKESLVSRLNNVGDSTDVEDVTPTLVALAPYYGTDDGVKSAVDKGAIWLSQHQNRDGTFSSYGTSNANTSALAVVALSALGIDAHADSRFVKDKSALEGLFSFALADHSGFGYKGNVTYNELATEQGFRALVAYARMKENGMAYNIYLEAKDSSGVVKAPEVSVSPSEPGGGGTTQPETPEETEVSVSVSVMVPPEGGAEGQYTYRHNRSEYTNLLGRAATIAVPEGTTALSVLEEALDGAGITYSAGGGYVTQIGGLAEFDHGPRSGWQYLVDGSAPVESASTYTFTEDAGMVWYYTDDYAREESGEQWAEPEPEAPAAEAQEDGTYQVTIPQDHSGPSAVEIPEARPGQLVVIVRADGTQEVLKKALVEDGAAYLLLEEDAQIRIVDYESGFEDVSAGAWYASAVDFVSGRGLLSGVSGYSFAPDEGLSRGMLVTALYALEEPGEQSWASLFDDVSDEAWYARGTAWAAQAGIVSGYGDGTFGPEDPITREELAVMLYGYAGYLGLETAGQAELSAFADGGTVSPWAAEAVAWAVDAGILGGKDGGLLDPAGGATRAEAAAMLQALVSWMLK